MAGTGGSIDRNDDISIGDIETRAIAMELVCADGEPAIRYIKSLDGVDTVTFIGADGAPLTPTEWIPGPCVLLSSSVSQQLVCADGEPAIRQLAYDELGVVTESFVGADGDPLTPTAWFPGDCCACDHTPLPMVPGLRKITGVTPFTPAAGSYRSFTITAKVGDVQISWGGSEVAIISAGQVMTWGAAGPQDGYFASLPTMTGQAAGSEYYVAWIAH